MNTTIGCPIPGASQPKEPVRLVDANSILRSIDVNGSAYDGIEYQAYNAGAEYVRGLIEDAPTIDPESLRPTAYWKRIQDAAYMCTYCKSCFAFIPYNYQYCPECSAKMLNAYAFARER